LAPTLRGMATSSAGVAHTPTPAAASSSSPRSGTRRTADGVCRPFIKWAGGKRQLLPELQSCVPAHFERYIEPFVGGGALFFRLSNLPLAALPLASERKPRALLADVNQRLIRTYQGVRECDKGLLEVARSYRSSEWLVWRDVLLPFALPYITAGVRLAIGRGLVGMVIAEFYTTITGLGFMITRYANVFEMDKTFVPVIVLMVLGVSLTSVLKLLERRIAPWSNANR